MDVLRFATEESTERPRADRPAQIFNCIELFDFRSFDYNTKITMSKILISFDKMIFDCLI